MLRLESLSAKENVFAKRFCWKKKFWTSVYDCSTLDMCDGKNYKWKGGKSTQDQTTTLGFPKRSRQGSCCFIPGLTDSRRSKSPPTLFSLLLLLCAAGPWLQNVLCALLLFDQLSQLGSNNIIKNISLLWQIKIILEKILFLAVRSLTFFSLFPFHPLSRYTRAHPKLNRLPPPNQKRRCFDSDEARGINSKCDSHGLNERGFSSFSFELCWMLTAADANLTAEGVFRDLHSGLDRRTRTLHFNKTKKNWLCKSVIKKMELQVLINLGNKQFWLWHIVTFVLQAKMYLFSRNSPFLLSYFPNQWFALFPFLFTLHPIYANPTLCCTLSRICP